MEPFDDPDYIAGSKAQDDGDFGKARGFFERAAHNGNLLALGELCIVCDLLGDKEAVEGYSQTLEAMAHQSAEAAYVAAKTLESCLDTFSFDDCKQKHYHYLVKAAEIGSAIAQLEVASNFFYGANGFAHSLSDAKRWIGRAATALPLDELPDWAKSVLSHNA